MRAHPCVEDHSICLCSPCHHEYLAHLACFAFTHPFYHYIHCLFATVTSLFVVTPSLRALVGPVTLLAADVAPNHPVSVALCLERLWVSGGQLRPELSGPGPFRVHVYLLLPAVLYS